MWALVAEAPCEARARDAARNPAPPRRGGMFPLLEPSVVPEPSSLGWTMGAHGRRKDEGPSPRDPREGRRSTHDHRVQARSATEVEGGHEGSRSGGAEAEGRGAREAFGRPAGPAARPRSCERRPHEADAARHAQRRAKAAHDGEECGGSSPARGPAGQAPAREAGPPQPALRVGTGPVIRVACRFRGAPETLSTASSVPTAWLP